MSFLTRLKSSKSLGKELCAAINSGDFEDTMSLDSARDNLSLCTSSSGAASSRSLDYLDAKETPPPSSIRYISVSQFTEMTKLVNTNAENGCNVWKATCLESESTVVLKIYTKSKLSRRDRVHMEREIRVMKELAHEPRLVKFLGDFEDELCHYIVLEYCSGGDLFDELDKRKILDEKWVATVIIKPLLQALNSLHTKHNIIHRDIKPENILLDAHGRMKLADFGLAIPQHQELPFLLCGTLDFMAPEVLDNPGSATRVEDPLLTLSVIEASGHWVYDEKVDVWSVGVLAYELIVGESPFAKDEKKHTAQAIRKARWEVPKQHKYRRDWQDFVKMALQVDSKKRPSAAELLAHPWLQKGNSISYGRSLAAVPRSTSLPAKLTTGAVVVAAENANRIRNSSTTIKEAALAKLALSEKKMMLHNKIFSLTDNNDIISITAATNSPKTTLKPHSDSDSDDALINTPPSTTSENTSLMSLC